MQAEDALDPALAAALRDGLGEVGDDGLEAEVRGGDGLAHLLHLPLVLDEAQGGQEGGELVVGLGQGGGLGTLGGACGVELGGQLAVGVAHHAHRDLAGVLGCGVGNSSMWRAVRPSSASMSSMVGRAPTQNSPYRVSAKNSSLSRPASGRKYRMASWPPSLDRLEDEHGVRLAVPTEAREVGKRAVRAEDVVRVVAAHLQAASGHDEPLAGEGLAHACAALRGIRRSL